MRERASDASAHKQVNNEGFSCVCQTCFGLARAKKGQLHLSLLAAAHVARVEVVPARLPTGLPARRTCCSRSPLRSPAPRAARRAVGVQRHARAHEARRAAFLLAARAALARRYGGLLRVLPAALSVSNISHALTKLDVLPSCSPHVLLSLGATEPCTACCPPCRQCPTSRTRSRSSTCCARDIRVWSLDAVEACADWLMKEGEPRHDANTAWAFARLYCTRQKRARFAPLAPFVWLGLGGWRGRRWTAACYAEREEESQAKREHATALIRSLLNNSS